MTHGSFKDRGAADSYYGRAYRPHCWLDPLGCRQKEAQTPEEIAAYKAGWDENERIGDFKDWGRDAPDFDDCNETEEDLR